MSEPVNNIAENIEESSVNKFDPAYKKLVVIKKCVDQMLAGMISETLAPGKGPLVCLPFESCAPLSLLSWVYSVSASASIGAVLTLSEHFHITFITKFIKTPALKVTWTYFVCLKCKNVLILEKTHNVFHFSQQTYFLASFPYQLSPLQASHPPETWAMEQSPKQTDTSLYSQEPVPSLTLLPVF